MTSNAVDKPSPYALVMQYQAEFADSLPSHMERQAAGWTRQVAALTRNDGIAKAVRAGGMPSLIGALRTAARLGLAPMSPEFYLVPFGAEVTGIIGYQGHVELMYRAGVVQSVVCEIVRENDRFDYMLGVDDVPRHDFDPFADPETRGEKRGVYAYAKLAGGATSRVVTMGAAEVERHRKASKSAHKPSSPWNTWPDAMWRKTAVRELSKWVPTSPEIIRVQTKAAMDGVTGRNDAEPGEPFEVPEDADTIDAEIMDDEPDVNPETGEVIS